ncbi:glycosyltransferase family 4 protein [bacterium]|uniref:Glycosyl transferase n=2 Tax=Katanobacteria TaxID=422282 RepID=A0A2M7X3X6_UNCKA|nr:glycosyltransferase family 4 protein [bacterium]PIP56997.1 MAG: glycosyl transferase [candidate division WWE3 bacterium CG22_combo_CG10-13_8_21_14_all_39_12]PJA40885.1 MAG: glycosyl transferase [candidate division WWE3 bacterium CG_4_9_14_3_um_filter_39_7]
MKIGIYCTNNLIYPVPSGTIYANMSVAGNLADELTEIGHDVTFFAPEGTQTKANLESFGMKPFSDQSVQKEFAQENGSYHYENLMLIKTMNYMVEHGFDLLHCHTRPYSIIEFAPLVPNLTTVITIHDPITARAYDTLHKYNQFQNLHFVSLSISQRTPQPKVQWAGNVYNGIDTSAWNFSKNPGQYLLYVGRIIPEKGVDTAIQVALKTGLPLKIAGTLYDGMEEFFDTKIRPFLGNTIEYLGGVSPTELSDLYEHAIALINPIRWEEPFGLVMIEAMASGTPVISTNNGSVSEIVIHGKTGFIANDPENIDEISGFVNRISEINRNNCRDHVVNNFSRKAMAQNYVNLYSKIQI